MSDVKKTNEPKFLIFIIILLVLIIAVIVGGIFIYDKNKGSSENFEDKSSLVSVESNKKTPEQIEKEKIEKARKEQEELEKKLEEERLKEIEKNRRLSYWNDNAVQEIKNIYSSDEKQVYLTFDDGPSEEVTPILLDILKEEKVPATFFVVGKCVDANPELVKREYEEGHFIANHGYTHSYSTIYSSVENVLSEYKRTNESVQKAIENPEYESHMFRFPGGSSGGPYDSLKQRAKSYLIENKIANTNWNCLTSDAVGKNSVESQYNEALNTQGKQTSLIILMHDASDKQYTAETTKLLIKHYKEEGYTFKNFYEIFNDTLGTEEIVSNEINDTELQE